MPIDARHWSMAIKGEATSEKSVFPAPENLTRNAFADNH